MFILLSVGFYKLAFGGLQKFGTSTPGLVPVGKGGSGVLLGASVFLALKAFGSGGAAVTGVEAISNGVPAFKEPSWKNARDTLVVMGALLGVMFLGLSVLAAMTHAIPYVSGTPTVISLVGKAVYGTSPLGHALFYFLQAGTMAILVLAANTSFADFPRLASFHAGDNFMPRQFMNRGHRLVFSNGILFLSGAGIVVLLATGGQVSRLIPLYAIGVFTSFTLSRAGMAKHHITRKEEGWRTGLAINATGAFLSFVILAIVAAVKFTEGAWVICLLIPIMVAGLMRLNKAYMAEEAELVHGAALAAEAPILHKHSVIILVDRLDAAAARAIQFGRSLRPDDMRAVHFDLDPWQTQQLAEQWSKLGLSSVPLDIIECPDRRVARSAAEVAAQASFGGITEVSVCCPDGSMHTWHRVRHDRSSKGIVAAVSDIAHCNVTIVPYHLGRNSEGDAPPAEAGRPSLRLLQGDNMPSTTQLPASRDRMESLVVRRRASVAGRIHSVRVQPWGEAASLECSMVDDTGSVTLVFVGRRSVPGIRIGSWLSAEGMAGMHHGNEAILNPLYEFLIPPEAIVAPHH